MASSALPTVTSPSSLLPRPLTPRPHASSFLAFRRLRPFPLTVRRLPLPLPASSATDEADGIKIEEIVEKDWSFLQPETPDHEWSPKARRILSAASLGAASRVLVSFGGARLLDRLMEDFPCELVFAIHDSLIELALIKERQDDVRCLQGPLEEFPAKFSPFNAIILCYFPAMGLSVNELLQDLARRLSQDARVVIAVDQGRQVVEQVHRKEHSDVVTSDLPSRASLDKAATNHSFKLIDFVDDPTFYLAVLEFSGP